MTHCCFSAWTGYRGQQTPAVAPTTRPNSEQGVKGNKNRKKKKSQCGMLVEAGQILKPINHTEKFTLVKLKMWVE